MSDIAILKKSDRDVASIKRQNMVSSAAGELASTHFLNTIELSASTAISLYWPIGSELDTRPLLAQLRQKNVPCLLPVVKGKNQPLIFKSWSYGDPLEKGGFGTYVPEAKALTGIPKILIVPLLAFDANGYRLGYGGGFYDRTLQNLRREEGCVAIGYAYSGQEVKNVTIDKFDQRLDWIITEKDARKIQ